MGSLTLAKKVVAYVDGASRGNPGPAAFAYVITRDGELLSEEAGCLGPATNNLAEYTALVRALESRPDAGMCASQVRFFGEPRLDSAGMLIARDGSSRQRGHARPPEDFPVAEEILLPSGSAAL